MPLKGNISPVSNTDSHIRVEALAINYHGDDIVLLLGTAGKSISYLFDSGSGGAIAEVLANHFKLFEPKSLDKKSTPKPSTSVTEKDHPKFDIKKRPSATLAKAASFSPYEDGVLISFDVEGKTVAYFLDNLHGQFFGSCLADHFKLFQFFNEDGTSKSAPDKPSLLSNTPS